MPWLRSLSALLLLSLLAGCASTTVRTTHVDPIMQDSVPLPEDLLLDVGVGLFDPGFSDIEDDPLFDPDLRDAEARFMPVVLMDTLQRTGNWGVVRVIPNRQSEMDVWVEARIVHSDGERLELDVIVEDSSRQRWYRRSYQATASKFSYDPSVMRSYDAFQSIYNRIANDMHAYAQALSEEQRRGLRTISELTFAQRFAPEVFGAYLRRDEQGIVRIGRLPAEDDAILQRVRRIRDRDYVFTDVLQDYYVGYYRQIQATYNGWREETYQQVMDLREARATGNAQIVGGTIALLGGLAAGIAGGSTAIQAAGISAAMAGYPLISDGIERKAQAAMHVTNIKELTASFNNEIQPHTVELEDRIVRLTGTVEEQYAQWRALLEQIWAQEIGMPVSAGAAAPGTGP